MLRYRIDRALRLVLLTAEGELTLPEVLEVQASSRNDPDFDPSFGLLADYRAVTNFTIDAAGMRRIAGNAPLGRTARRAFVVRGVVGYGILRMFEAFAELAERGGAVKVFDDDIEAALRWLREPSTAT